MRSQKTQFLLFFLLLTFTLQAADPVPRVKVGTLDATLMAPKIFPLKRFEIIPTDYPIVMDFTFSQEAGLKVIEFGGKHDAYSTLNGHEEAYPKASDYKTIYAEAGKDYATRTGRRWITQKEVMQNLENRIAIDIEPSLENFGQEDMRGLLEFIKDPVFLGGHTSDKVLGNKGFSMLLDGEKTLPHRPRQTIVRKVDIKNMSDQSLAELVGHVQALGTKHIIVKPSASSLSEGISLVDRETLVDRLSKRVLPPGTDIAADSLIFQAFQPTDFMRFTELGPNGKNYSPTGRIYFRAIADGKDLYLYPITMYWKVHGGYPAGTTEITPDNVNIKSMDFGAAMTPQEQREILEKTSELAAVVAPLLVELDQYRLQGSSKYGQELRQHLSERPEYERKAILRPNDLDTDYSKSFAGRVDPPPCREAGRNVGKNAH